MTRTNRRGFAAMDPERQREIASKGGRTAHAKGTAHKFTSEEAKKAGRKGGQSVSQDRTHMSTIGRTGGKNSRRSLEVELQAHETLQSIKPVEIPEAVGFRELLHRADWESSPGQHSRQPVSG